ncbi:MAG: sulfurtransferase TusA family protein [Planctomycetota bacterium]|jgi:tRNA 2-thiouridine synthesizing protein A
MLGFDDFADDDLAPTELTARTTALQATVDAIASAPCRRCGASLCGHAALLAVLFGCKDAPRCPDCLAVEHREPKAALVARASEWIRRKDCFRHVWHAASAREHGGEAEAPSCLGATAIARGPAPAAIASGSAASSAPAPVATYDAGDLGCGDLVLELRGKLREIGPGEVLRVFARDPAAPVDLPAWCGLTGHTLVRATHPEYHLQRKPS